MSGIAVMLMAAIFLAVENVLVRVLFQGSWFGGYWVGDVLPADFAHTLLFVQWRTLVMVLLLALLSFKFYSPTFADIKTLVLVAEKRRWLWLNILSGGIFFVNVLLLYFAIGNVPAGIAITLFFIHPVAAAVLAWVWFGARPSKFRSGIMLVVLFGLVAATGHFQFHGEGNLLVGSLAALAAGVGFAGYATIAQQCLRWVHPIPFSLIAFFIMFLLTSISIVWLQISPPVGTQIPLLFWSLLSGAVTLAGLLFHNMGIGLVGAPTAALVGASEPIFTSLLAWLLLRETLQPGQVLGVLLVTIGIAALSIERRRKD
jgi:drug/metabolite transporter (DMT)-like permease